MFIAMVSELVVEMAMAPQWLLAGAGKWTGTRFIEIGASAQP